jgi:hypothetical protein
MTISTHIRNARTAAVDLVEKARGAVSKSGEKAAEARRATIYTPEGQDEIASGWAQQARRSASAAMETAEKRVANARAKAQKALKDARTVPNSERQAAYSALAPVIGAAAHDPEVLINAYRKRASGSLAEKLVLEEAIQACIDGGLGGYQFPELWENTRMFLGDTVYTPAEKAALEDLAAVGALESYVSSAHTALEADLRAVETGEASMHTIQNVRAWHNVAQYEKGLEAGTLDDGALAEDVLQAEDVLEGSGDIGEDFEPQHIPEEVRQDTEARRAALGG